MYLRLRRGIALQHITMRHHEREIPITKKAEQLAGGFLATNPKLLDRAVAVTENCVETSAHLRTFPVRD